MIAAGAVAATVLLAIAFVLRPSRAPELMSGIVASTSARHTSGSALPNGEALTALAPSRVQLTGGHWLDLGEGTQFSLGADSLAVERGEASVVESEGHDLSVTTPFGVIQGKAASYRVAISESTMNRTTVAASGLVLTVAVIGGAIVFTSAEESMRVAAPHELVVREGRAETRDPSRPGTASPSDALRSSALDPRDAARLPGRGFGTFAPTEVDQLLRSSSRSDQIDAIELLLRAGTPEAAKLLVEALQATTDPVLTALLEEALLKSPLDLSPAIQAAFSSVKGPGKLAILARLLTQLVTKRPDLEKTVVAFFVGALSDGVLNPERADSASKALVALGPGAVDEVVTFLTDRKTGPLEAGTAAWVLTQLSSGQGDLVRQKLGEGFDANEKALSDPDLPDEEKMPVRKKTGSLAWVAIQRPEAEHDHMAEMLVDKLARTTDEEQAGTLAWGIVSLKGLSEAGRMHATQVLLDSLVGQRNANLAHAYVRAISEMATAAGVSPTGFRRLVDDAWAAHGRDPQVAPHLERLRTQLAPR
jgi:hypothetical protein